MGERFVGRIGRVKGDESDYYVNVDSYDADTSEYLVKLLQQQEAEGGVKRVKSSNVEFQTTPEFVDAFPNPPHFIIQGKLDMKSMPSGSVVDFTECISDPLIDGEKLSVMGSYRFVGKRSESIDSGASLTRLPYCVYIAAPNASDIVEFENILFELGRSDSHCIVCLRGTIVFRNCIIKGATHGLKVGSGNAPVTVTFENGSISNRGGCGVIVETKAQFTMIQTSIDGTGVGMYVTDGGTFYGYHCSVFNHSFGLLTCGKHSVTQLNYCSFNGQRHCGVLVNSGAIFMEHCNVSGVNGNGIVICDLVNGIEAYLNYCKVSNCRCGVRVSGKTRFNSVHLLVSECEIGVYVHAWSMWSVVDMELYGPLYNNNTIDFVNFSDARSTVTINDAKQSTLDSDKQQRIQDVHDTVLRLPDKAKELSSALCTVWPIKVKRYLTRLDVQVNSPHRVHYLKVCCHVCGKLEPANASALMKKCGGCEQVCYCSENCRDPDWPWHKHQCRMPNNWHRELYSMQFLDCQLCHKITSRISADDFKRIKCLHFCKNCVTNHFASVNACVNSMTY